MFTIKDVHTLSKTEASTEGDVWAERAVHFVPVYTCWLYNFIHTVTHQLVIILHAFLLSLYSRTS